MEKSYKQYLSQINTLIFDVDGVLTNGVVTILSNGELIRHMNIKDGYALRAAVKAGLRICIITGGKNEGVKIRLKNLGIEDVYMGAHNKIEQYNECTDKYNLKSENILYMGDDLPDYPIMKIVGLSAAMLLVGATKLERHHHHHPHSEVLMEMQTKLMSNAAIMDEVKEKLATAEAEVEKKKEPACDAVC